MSQEQFAHIVLDRKQLADKDAGEYHETYLANGHLGLADDRDAGELAEAGWGIIFAENEDPAVKLPVAAVGETPIDRPSSVVQTNPSA